MTNKIRIILISVIVFMIFAIVFLIFYINKLKEIDKYKALASQYLKTAYNEDFDLKFSSSGYKVKLFASFDQYGTLFNKYDKNIKEYVFKVYSKNLPIQSYVTVWNISDNYIEINEINGKKSHTVDTSFAINKIQYYEKIKIKTDLDNMLQNNYDDYEVNYNFKQCNNKLIIVSFNHSLVKELDNNLENIKLLMELNKQADVHIKVEFIDYVTIYEPTKVTEKQREKDFEREKEYFTFVKEIYDYLEKKDLKNYSVEKKEYLTINLNYRIIDKNEMDKIIKELKSISKKYYYQKHATLYFKNDTLDI